MDDREALLAQIKRAYDAREVGALDDLMAHFHPEAVFTLAGDPQTTAIAGTLQGYAQVRQGMTDFIANFKFGKRHIVSELMDGNCVAVRSRVAVRYSPNNIEQEIEVVDLFKFQDGKIIELIEFADTAAIVKMIS